MSRVVLDAGIGAGLVLPMTHSFAARQRLAGWIADDTEIWVPTLWAYEVVSAVRKHVAAGILSDDMAAAAIVALAGLGVQAMEPDVDMHQHALTWAGRLNQPVAYDGAYLAVAERLGAELWTIDGRLARRAETLGLAWVKMVS